MVNVMTHCVHAKLRVLLGEKHELMPHRIDRFYRRAAVALRLDLGDPEEDEHLKKEAPSLMLVCRADVAGALSHEPFVNVGFLKNPFALSNDANEHIGLFRVGPGLVG